MSIFRASPEWYGRPSPECRLSSERVERLPASGEHRVCVLLAAVEKLDLLTKLELDPIKSLDLFHELLVNLRAHTFKNAVGSALSESLQSAGQILICKKHWPLTPRGWG